MADNVIRLRFKNPTYIRPEQWKSSRDLRTRIKQDWYNSLDTAQQNLLQSVYRWDIVVVDYVKARSEVFLEIEVAKPKQATMAQLLFY
jgi:hypothetical protein